MSNHKVTQDQEKKIAQFAKGFFSYQGPHKKTYILKRFLTENKIFIKPRRAYDIMRKFQTAQLQPLKIEKPAV